MPCSEHDSFALHVTKFYTPAAVWLPPFDVHAEIERFTKERGYRAKDVSSRFSNCCSDGAQSEFQVLNAVLRTAGKVEDQARSSRDVLFYSVTSSDNLNAMAKHMAAYHHYKICIANTLQPETPAAENFAKDFDNKFIEYMQDLYQQEVLHIAIWMNTQSGAMSSLKSSKQLLHGVEGEKQVGLEALLNSWKAKSAQADANMKALLAEEEAEKSAHVEAAIKRKETMRKKKQRSKARKEMPSIDEAAASVAELELAESHAAPSTTGGLINLSAAGSIGDRDTEDGRAESTVGGDTTCIVCFAHPKTHMALPCLHQCLCQTCAKKIYECPYCRTPVERWLEPRLV